MRSVVLAIVCGLGCQPVAAEPPPADAARGFATPAQVFARTADPDTIGLEVHLENARIAAKAGRGVWISNGRRRVFVVLIDPSHVETLPVGSRIDIRGELRRAPAAREAALSYGVGPRAARRIAASPHIIDAWSVTAPM